MEFVDLEPHAGRVDQLGEQHAALDERDRAAVLRRRGEHVVGRGDPRRHVLHDDRGLAGNVLAEMARRHPRLQIVPAAHAGADDERDLPARVELIRGGRRRATPISIAAKAADFTRT